MTNLKTWNEIKKLSKKHNCEIEVYISSNGCESYHSDNLITPTDQSDLFNAAEVIAYEYMTEQDQVESIHANTSMELDELSPIIAVLVV